jgi:hypothetical protein
VGDITTAIEYHLQGKQNRLSLATMLAARNVFQHRLLSLPHAVELGEEPLDKFSI